MKLPEFTYHVIVKWPDGAALTTEHGLSRDDAFTTAGNLIIEHGCEVRVEMIERNPATGGCLGVSDVTALFMAERDIPADPLEVPCGDCGRSWCTCDEAYDARKIDDIMEQLQ